ncbi:MAG: VanZ family protein [Thiobacillus sp.]|nr:VanZ family protein [Thiobacillus sp.]
MTATLRRRIGATRNRRATRITRVWLACGWLGVIVTLVVSLMPPALGNADSQADKLVHLFGYALLMFWWAQLVTQRRWKLAIAVVLYGIAIEGLQGLTPERQPDILDALANSGGVLFGWLAARVLPNLPQSLAALPARSR